VSITVAKVGSNGDSRPDRPGMSVENENRAAESPYIDRVYRSDGVLAATRMHSIASAHWELAFAETQGRLQVAIRGPETKPTSVVAEPETRWFGIVFAHGAVMPHLPVPRLVDSAVLASRVTPTTLMLRGEEWELPNFDNAEDFVQRLVRAGIVVRDPLVADVLAGSEVPPRSVRSVQRRVVAATGLPQRLVRQIDRARQAAVLLGGGATALDAVHLLGYYDQPHLARSLTRFLGRTATQLQHLQPDEALSLLYKPDE
jgi:hypothetical protein